MRVLLYLLSDQGLVELPTPPPVADDEDGERPVGGLRRVLHPWQRRRARRQKQRRRAHHNDEHDPNPSRHGTANSTGGKGEKLASSSVFV